MSGTYDLVILDIKMHNIDGIKLIKLYHQLRGVDKDVKVCFITASEEYYIEHFSEIKEEKCFMQKLISLDNFVDHIKLALAESTIQRR
jgi:DNA-binding LytR/AlgR family response regulator